MIKLYALYLLTAFLNFSIIIVGLDEGIEPANYTSLMTLAGCLLLSTVAAPLIIYKTYVALFIGLAGCLLLIPLSIILLEGVFDNDITHSGVLILTTPLISVLLTTYLTIKKISDKSYLSEIFINKFIKFFLVVIPILLFAFYVIFKDTSWFPELLIF